MHLKPNAGCGRGAGGCRGWEPHGRGPGVGASLGAPSQHPPPRLPTLLGSNDDDFSFNLCFISIKQPESCKYMCSPIDAGQPLMLIYGGEAQPIHNCTLKKGGY